MEILKKETLRRDSMRALARGALVFAMVLATVVAVSAEPPPATWTPPEAFKAAIPEPDSLALGDTVSFLIVVNNPAYATPPDVVVD